MYFIFDPLYLLIIGVGFALSALASFGVKRTFSRYSQVRDLAFDNLGRKFFLDSKGGWGGYCKVRVEKANGRFIGRPLDIEDKEFSSIAVQGWHNGVPGAMYAIEDDTKTILRYDFAGVSWEGLFKRAPLEMGQI